MPNRIVYDIDGNIRPIENKLSKIESKSSKVESKLAGGAGSKGIGGMLGGLTSMLPALGAAAAGAAAVGIVKLGGELQTTRTQFQTFLGSVEAGNSMLDKLASFANATPFSNDEINKAGKTLLSFGFDGEEILPTLKMLGDISAGTGKDLSELGRIFGKIKGNGRLMGGELDMLIDSGFNPLQLMAEKLAKGDMSKIPEITLKLRKEMAAGQISFERVVETFREATSEGGDFYNMTGKLAETFEGKLSTALGKGRYYLAQLGEKLLPVVNKVLDWIIKQLDAIATADFSPLVSAFEAVWSVTSELGSMIGELIGSFTKGESTLNGWQIFFNGLAISIRMATLPFRTFIKFGVLVMQTADELKKQLKGIGDVIIGTLTLDPERIQKGFASAVEGGQAVRKKILSGMTDFAKEEAQAFAKVFNADYTKKKAEETTDESVIGKMAGKTGTATSTGAATSGARSSGVGGISGGANLKNFTINIDSLVETISFNKTGGETDQELADRITRILVGAVNNTQRLAGG